MKIFNHFIWKLPFYKLAHENIIKSPMPLNFTFSVTNLCQSKCKTCNIWKIYREDPKLYKKELNINEIEKIFSSLGNIYIFNVSGGEPFIRKDFLEIVKLAVKYLKPKIIHIPTNAIAEKKVIKTVKEIIEHLKQYAPDTKLTIKPSLDHIYEKHDDIRGVKGNFNKVMNVFTELKKLKKEYNNLYAELGTVISKMNFSDIEYISDFVRTLKPDSYRNEIAEIRSEMFNLNNDITPDYYEYRKAIDIFAEHQKKEMKNRSFFQKTTNAFRLVYYDLVLKILQKNNQPIPCYAGITNAHMTAYGDVWACCTLGYDDSMGNLRDFNYNFKKLWNSNQAFEVRKKIYNKECVCPLANQMYSSILMDFKSSLKVVMIILRNKKL
ncbi:MAG: radical SAM/SPASM domain-containing protein [Candidatus Muiribacteriota bacterium]